MRAILFQKIHESMRLNQNLFFLTAGVGFNLIEPMCKEFPDRAMNVGIAEQNLVGVAAGLSNLGFKVICYSYTNFLAERALEQIRNDICLHRYAPILIGTTTGFDNAGLGATHHALDDIGVLKALPHLSLYSPSSSESIGMIFDEALASREASFIRFTKNDFSEGQPISDINRFMINNHSDILILSHGKMVANALKASSLSPIFDLFAMDRIKPIDNGWLKKLFAAYKKIIVVEDNFKSGLFNSVAQWMAENDIKNTRLHSISVEEKYRGEIGDPNYLEDLNGLSPEKIAGFIRSA
ncbi:MAG: transketolase, C-terminal subunit [Parcubacteria group bacterium Greene0714_36]|nr:MAG: transketolase, C-terminal subunit [Parcubacteria group bacterium Greene0714_36]